MSDMPNRAHEALRVVEDILNTAYLQDKISHTEFRVSRYSINEILMKIEMAYSQDEDYQDEKYREQFDHYRMLEEIYHD